MIELLQVLSRLSTASKYDFTWKVLMVFCLAGLVISLVLVNNGIDITAGFRGYSQ